MSGYVRTTMHNRRFTIPILSAVLIVLAPVIVRAHDPGLSALDVRVTQDRLIASLAFAREDIERLANIDTNRDGVVTDAEITAAQPNLKAVAAEALELRLDDRQLRLADVETQLDSTGGIQFLLTYHAVSGQRLTLRSKLIPRFGLGHRQFLSIRDQNNNVIDERLLSGSSEAVELVLGESSTPYQTRSVIQFVQLGIIHILTGYDHLLFLVGLLIVGNTFGSAAKIITSFTVAHSITLVASTLGYLTLAPSLVEPLIAASIIYVGFENLFRRDLKLRWVVSFGFGLIHGFGFAYVLNELGVGASGSTAVVPLFSFNLGVELGQLGVAALMLPLIWRFRHRPAFLSRVAPAFSLLIVAAGGYWLIDRVI